ncbi:MAG: hypothetical protein LBQ65_01485, partial [Tannerellaceae bacterium]|nr:hypothetical protein [Tannerellaceae bacterium]
MLHKEAGAKAPKKASRTHTKRYRAKLIEFVLFFANINNICTFVLKQMKRHDCIMITLEGVDPRMIA